MSRPFIETELLTPEIGREGSIAICTNTLAPGQVHGQLPDTLREQVPVLGSLKVSRGGAELMIVNALADPTIQSLLLFGPECGSFYPSTNLLQAIRGGYLLGVDGNKITDSVGVSAQYPNISEEILEQFKDTVSVLPVFTSTRKETATIVDAYLDEFSERLGLNIVDAVRKANGKKRIDYDVLSGLLTYLSEQTSRRNPKVIPLLDSATFSRLQPPIIELEVTTSEILKTDIPLRVEVLNRKIKVTIADENGIGLELGSDDWFELANDIEEACKALDTSLNAEQQLSLGILLGRASVLVERNESGLLNDVGAPPKTEQFKPGKRTGLRTDKQYYYLVKVRPDGKLAIRCMAHDDCEEVFELRSQSSDAIVERLADDDRFENYDHQLLHRIYVGAEIARADEARIRGLEYLQDFSLLFELNTEYLPTIRVEADTFATLHRRLVGEILARGVTEAHADVGKGTARTAVVLATLRDASSGFASQLIPRSYAQGSVVVEDLRESYKQQLLRPDHDGSYSYGERTTTFFGHNQLDRVNEVLVAGATTGIIQRYDPSVDMSLGKDEITGESVSSHDPCLTHDVYFVVDGKLHSLHIARAHNTVNAYPENIWGLYDAYDSTVSQTTGLPIGDFHMLSSRANILLLTEQEKAKAIVAESTKPSDDHDTTSGPHRLDVVGASELEAGLQITTLPLSEVYTCDHEFIERLVDYRGVDTIERAIKYFEDKGVKHNNPILTTFDARIDDPSGSHLVFFQANVMGGKLCVTSILTGRSSSQLENDLRLCNYLASKIALRLGMPLGELMFGVVNGQ